MTTTVADIRVVVSAQTDKAQKNLQALHGEVSKGGGLWGAASKAVSGFVGGLGAGAGFVAAGLGVASLSGAFDMVTGAITGTISAAADSQAVMAQTNAVLQSTHGISGQTAQSIADFASKMQNLTGIDDEAIQGAENMLATFTNLKGNVFPGASKAVLDMATAMNGGAIPSADQLRQTAIQVGKALNDPIAGVSALQRVGVKLSQTQLDQVKHFIQVGDAADAQKVILGELTKEFGGAAEAAGGTLTGKLALLQGQLGNVQEAIGGAVIPVLSNLLGAVTPLITSFAGRLPDALSIVGHLFAQVFDGVSEVGQAFQSGLQPALAQITQSFSGMQSPLDGISMFIGRLSGGLADLAPTFAQVGGTVGGIVLTAFRNAGPLFGNLGSIIQQLAPIFLDLASHALPLVGRLMQFIGQVGAGILLPLLANLAGFLSATVVPIIGLLGQFLGRVFDVLGNTVLPALQQAATAIQTQLLPPLQNIIQRVLPILNGLFQVLGFLLGNVIGPILGAVLGPVLSLIITILGKLLGAVGFVLDKLGELKDHLVTALQPAIKNVSGKLAELHSWFNDKILPVIKAVQQFFQTKILPVLEQVGGFVRDKVVANLQTMWSIIQSKVLPILGDLAGKIKDSIGRQFQVLGDVIHTITGKIGDFLGNIGHIKDFFANLHLEFPKIKLPHFSIVGDFSLNPPQVPHLDVKWYATGGIAGLHGPELIGVGEREPEAVIPLSQLGRGRGAGAGGGEGAGAQNVTLQLKLEVGGRDIAVAVGPEMVKELRRYGIRLA